MCEHRLVRAQCGHSAGIVLQPISARAAHNRLQPHVCRPLSKTCFPDDMMLVRSPGHVSSIVDKVSACCSNSCEPPRLHSLLLLLAQPSQVPSPPPHTLVSPRIPLHPSHPRATHGPGPRLLRGAAPTVGDGDAPHSLGVRCHPARQQVQRWPGAQPPPTHLKGPCPLANSGLPSAPERRAAVAWAPKGRLQRGA